MRAIVTAGLVGACLAVLGAFPLAGQAQTAEMPNLSELKVGDRWEWRQFDNRTKLEEAGPWRMVVEEKGTKEFAFHDGQRQPLAYPYVNVPSAKPWRVWPLEVGKQWTVDVDAPTYALKQDAKVVGHEEVVVPAGKFMAFRIEHDGFVRLPSGFNGRIADTFWYAPDARADVKHVRRVANTNFTRELVRYPPLKPTPASGN
jgi:hypothetical protein